MVQCKAPEAKGANVDWTDTIGKCYAVFNMLEWFKSTSIETCYFESGTMPDID